MRYTSIHGTRNNRSEGYHGFPVDIWSAGIALYIIISGNLPFNRDKEHDLEYSILNIIYLLF